MSKSEKSASVDGDGVIYWQLDFEGSDCESCGWNNESVEVSVTDGVYKYQLSVGCFHGHGFENADQAKFVTELEAQREWLDRLGADLWLTQVISEIAELGIAEQ